MEIYVPLLIIFVCVVASRMKPSARRSRIGSLHDDLSLVSRYEREGKNGGDPMRFGD